jgi:hypothetical protein
MRTVILVVGVVAPLSLAVLAMPVMAQTANQPRPAAIQTQANPTGNGGYAFIPPDPATADSPVPAAMPADPAYHGGPYTGALTPPPAAAMDKTYPRCSATLHDNCTNRDQAGKRMRHATTGAQPD